MVTGVLATLALVGASAAGWWLWHHGSAAPAKSPTLAPPAQVGKPIKEDQLNVITLTREAQDRLRVRTGQITQQPMPARRLYGGEVMVPPGQAIVVSAPLG